MFSTNFGGPGGWATFAKKYKLCSILFEIYKIYTLVRRYKAHIFMKIFDHFPKSAFSYFSKVLTSYFLPKIFSATLPNARLKHFTYLTIRLDLINKKQNMGKCLSMFVIVKDDIWRKQFAPSLEPKRGRRRRRGRASPRCRTRTAPCAASRRAPTAGSSAGPPPARDLAKSRMHLSIKETIE